MAMWKKRTSEQEFEDDGRTIADMSGVEPKPDWSIGGTPAAPRPAEYPPAQNRPPWEKETFTGSQRFWAVLGAMKAAFLIGMAYVVGLGLIGLLLLWLWN